MKENHKFQEYGTGLEKVKQKLQHLWLTKNREERRKLILATGHFKPAIGGFTDIEYGKFYNGDMVYLNFDKLPQAVQDILIGTSYKFMKENPGAKYHMQKADEARARAEKYKEDFGIDSKIVTEEIGRELAHLESYEASKKLNINPKLSMQEVGEIYDSLEKPDKLDILTGSNITYYNINQVLHLKFKSLPLQIQQKVTNFLNSLSSNPRKSKDSIVKELRRTVASKWNSMIQYDRIPWVLHANITKTNDVAARIAFFPFKELGSDVQQALVDSYNDYWKKYKKNPSQFCVERVQDPKKFDKRSFRTKYARAHRLTVGCPKGQWDAKKQVCRVPMEVQRIMHPAGEVKCPIPGKELKNNPYVFVPDKHDIEEGLEHIKQAWKDWNYEKLTRAQAIHSIYDNMQNIKSPEDASILVDGIQKVYPHYFDFTKKQMLKSLKSNPQHNKVTILKNTSTGEYRVPGPAGTEAQAYYTDDKRDAIGTAQHMYGKDIQIGFRGVPDFDRFLKENPKSDYTIQAYSKKVIDAVKTWNNAGFKERYQILYYNLHFSPKDAEQFADKRYKFEDAPNWVKKALVNYYIQSKKNPRKYSTTQFGLSDSDIESTAVELYTQGHGVDDVRILLQKEFDFSKKDAEYWAKRASRIVRR